MGVVPGHLQEGIEGDFEIFAQLLMPGLVVLPQNVSCETFELPRVVVSRGQTGDQCLSETAALQRRNAGRQHMLRRAAVDAHGLALEAQFTGVAGGAGDVQKLILAAGVLMPGKADGQVTRVVRCGFLAWVDQETKACEVFGSGESLFARRAVPGR